MNSPYRSRFKLWTSAILAIGIVSMSSTVLAAYSPFPYAEDFQGTENLGLVTNLTGWSGVDFDTSSIVSNDFAFTETTRPIEPYTGTDNQVLELNTDGATLTNSFDMANMQTNVYLDTMVNFVAHDDDPEWLLADAETKLAVFLNANSNLYVMHGGTNGTTTSFTAITNAAITPEQGEWYRLTVHMDMQSAEGADPQDPQYYPFFKVMLNGNVLSNETAGFSIPTSGDPTLTEYDGGSWFRFANLGLSDYHKVNSINFQGTGMIDDLVLKTDEPVFGPAVQEFHTYTFNVSGLDSPYIVTDGLVNPVDADFSGMTPVQLSIAIDEMKDLAYTGMVRVAAANATDLQLWAKDTSDNWWDINEVGWGDSNGFEIDTQAVTDIYVIATNAFTDQAVALVLMDVDGDYGAVDNKIIDETVLVSAVAFIDGAPAQWVEDNWPGGTHPTDFSTSFYSSLGEMWLVGQTNEGVPFEIISIVNDGSNLVIEWFSAETPLARKDRGDLRLMSTDDLSLDISLWTQVGIVDEINTSFDGTDAGIGEGVNTFTTTAPVDDNLFYRLVVEEAAQ